MTVASRVGRHTKCGNTIIKMLLRLIIEAKFHVKHVIGDSTRKASLGSNLHAEFCINPNMICFADTSAGHQFSLKYRDLKCGFHKVFVDIQRTGSRCSPPQERFQFFDVIKEIMLLDPSFFPPIIISLLSILVETDAAPFSGPIFVSEIIDENKRCISPVTADLKPLHISEGSFEPSSWLSYQFSFRLPSTSASVSMPAPSLSLSSSLTSETKNTRLTQLELQSEFLRSSERETDIFDEAFISPSS
ncbi:hypothetical protein F4703DRAFT_1797407 [Phycomyces blakesleeanus]